jgi:hypothetical protein
MPNTRSSPFEPVETDQAGRITFVCRRRVSFEVFVFLLPKQLLHNATVLALAHLQMMALGFRDRQLVHVDAARPDAGVEDRLLFLVQQLVSATDSGVTNSDHGGDFLSWLGSSEEVTGHVDGHGGSGQGRAAGEATRLRELGCDCDGQVGSLLVHIEGVAETVAQVGWVLGVVLRVVLLLDHQSALMRQFSIL